MVHCVCSFPCIHSTLFPDNSANPLRQEQVVHISKTATKETMERMITIHEDGHHCIVYSNTVLMLSGQSVGDKRGEREKMAMEF